MTRMTAVQTVYEIVNSGIIDRELEDALTEIATHICDGQWEDCNTKDKFQNYCEGCAHEA